MAAALAQNMLALAVSALAVLAGIAGVMIGDRIAARSGGDR